MFVGLCFEEPLQEGNFGLGNFIFERDEGVRLGQVSIELGNFVFENQMIAKGVPGEIGKNAMILMPIIAEMSEDQVGLNETFELLEVIFDQFTLVGEEAGPEILYNDLRSNRALQEGFGAFPSFVGAGPFGTENHPKDFEIRFCAEEGKDSATAADFDVIGMGAEAEDRGEILRDAVNHRG